MKYLLDTNIIIDHIRGKVQIPLELLQEGVGISIISYGELYYGAHKSADSEKALRIVNTTITELGITVVALSQQIMNLYGTLKASLEKKGARLDDLDLMIAATALSHVYVLVTRNKKHFERIPGLQLFD